MELVEGSTLVEWLATKPSAAEVLEAFVAAGRGLAAAHAVGIVHRDFKPANVLRHHDGRVRVTDFGLARPSPATTPKAPFLSPALTQPGERPGTPAYMAPEQLAGRTVDARADQFGFCAALFEALYGVRAFEGQTLAEVRANIDEGRLRAPATRRPLTPNVHRALTRGLSARPSARFADMNELLAALKPARPLAPRVLFGAAVVSVAALAIVFVRATVGAESKCPPSAQRLTGVWDDAVRNKVAGAFATSAAPWAADVSASVAATLQAYSEAWARKHTETCEATWVRREQSEHALDLRMHCLDERRTELAAVTRYLAQLSVSSLDTAPAVLRGLTSLERCDDARRLERSGPPLSLEARAASDAIGAQVAEVKVLHDSGHFQEASTLLAALVPKLPSVADLTVQAEGWFWLGSIELRLGAVEPARQHLGRALTTASVVGGHDVQLRALCNLVELAAGLHDAKMTEEYRQLIEVSRRSAVGDAELEVIIENQLGLAAFGEGRLDQALEHFRSARRHFDLVKGPFAKNVARIINNIGAILSEQGKPAEGLVEVQAARDLLVAEYGATHPDVARAEVNLGEMCNQLSRFSEAVAHLELAERIQLQVLGARHPELAATHNNWGETCAATGDHAGALSHFETALSIREEALGKTHLQLVGDLNGVAAAQLKLGRRDEALKALERIVSLRAGDPAHPSELARAEVALGRELFVVSRVRAGAMFAAADEHFAAAGDSVAHERKAAKEWLEARRR
jgi:eukaryotic-like serine/threonine-protein kinase